MRKVYFYAIKGLKNLVVSTNVEIDSEYDDEEFKIIEPIMTEDVMHTPIVEKNDDGILIKFGKNNHPMSKNHYISYVIYVTIDSILVKELYPEQDAIVRFPDLGRGVIYSYCIDEGLYGKKI